MSIGTKHRASFTQTQLSNDPHMNSYCNVTNPTHHLEPNLAGCIHGDYEWRMYDDVPNYADDSESMKERRAMRKAK